MGGAARGKQLGDLMRVYLPSTLTGLGSALLAGQVGPPPVPGYAVTAALREWYASGDLEELEYMALLLAARASLRLLLADPAAPRRRVVLAAELDPASVEVSGELTDAGRVAVAVPVSLTDVVSAHVDDEAAVPDIEAAVAALPAADGGDGDARFVVDGAEGHELLWYAAGELIHLIG